jgi:hypothetical protein
VKPGIKRALSGRTMQVTTVFTGVAAAAAAFTPTAHAATAIEVRPGCPAGTSHWLHLNGFRVISSVSTQVYTCLGGSGTANPSFDATSFCGGNNYGYIEGHYRQTGEYYYTKFHQGTRFANIPDAYFGSNNSLFITKVHISGWSGSEKCGY